MTKLTVIFNGVPQLEYDREKPLQDHQLLYLQKMDEKMNAGITIGTQLINEPDINQRSQFVAANLAHAIKAEDESSMAAMCSYIAMRMPDIQQVAIDEQTNGEIEIDFRFEPAQTNVAFVAHPTRQ